VLADHAPAPFASSGLLFGYQRTIER
jgi:hypothetical protein